VSVTPPLIPADGGTPAVVEVRVRDAHGSPADGHSVRVRVDDVEVAAIEKEPGVYEAILAGRGQLGAVPVDVAVGPRTAICRRGRVVTLGVARVVLDARGIGCAGDFVVQSAAGDPLASGTLAAGGFIRLAEASYEALDGGGFLDLESALPTRVGVGSVPPGGVAEALEARAAARWVLPVDVDIRIREVGREGNTLSLVVETTGVDELAEHLRVTSSSGTVAVRGHEGNRLQVVVHDVSRPVEIMASDERTGVTAWLRVE
jgi:hypothetical protein